MLTGIKRKWGINKILESVLACVRVLHSSVWWWGIAYLTTNFHSFFDYWLFSMNARKCNKISLCSFYTRLSRICNKGLPPLFINLIIWVLIRKYYSLNNQYMYLAYIAFQTIIILFYKFLRYYFWDNRIHRAYSHTKRTWLKF